MEIGARYGRRTDKQSASGEADMLWHQIRDLLTLYYFNLCGNFRKDVLRSNSKSDDAWHSGIALDDLRVANPQRPTSAELREMRNKIRPLFNQVTPVLAEALLHDDLVSTTGSLTHGQPDKLPTRPGARSDPAVDRHQRDAHPVPERAGVLGSRELADEPATLPARQRRIGGLANEGIPEEPDLTGPVSATVPVVPARVVLPGPGRHRCLPPAR